MGGASFVMEVTLKRLDRVEDCLSKQCTKTSMNNLQIVGAMPYAAERGSMWRGLHKRCGNLHDSGTRMRA